MDKNKFEKLIEIDYRIQKTCYNCKYSHFQPVQSWGECSKHLYDHRKHSDSTRFLSISRDGYCPQYERNTEGISYGAYDELEGIEGGS